MSGTLLYAVLAGLLVFNPLIGLGFIPASALAATGRPRQAWPYATYGAAAIVLFSLGGWLLHFVLLLSGAMLLELPLDILMVWGVNRLLSAAVGRNSGLREQAPFYTINGAVLGAGLVVVDRYPLDFLPAMMFAAGLAAGLLAAMIVIAHFRGRIETGRLSPALAGWPVFLLLAALCWVGFEGLALLIR